MTDEPSESFGAPDADNPLAQTNDATPVRTGHAWTPTGAIAYGWGRITKEPGIILVTVVVMVITNGLNSIGQAIQSNASPGDDVAMLAVMALNFANLFVSAYISMGWTTYLLKVVRGQPAALSDVFSGGPYLRVLGATIVFVIVMMLGMCALIVPGIIFALGAWFFMYRIMDADATAIDSMKQSWAITRGHKMSLFVFMLLSIGIFILGLICCLVGAFVSGAITSVGAAWIYLKLTGQDVAPLS